MVIVIGNNVRLVRLSRGMTQHQASIRSSITQHGWSALERNVHDPKLSTISKAAEALQIPAWVLLLDSRSTLMRCVSGVPLGCRHKKPGRT
mgnify:CR=1 FL=1|jgi:transcriptional regulator with XRE-family HTH domain